MLRLFWYYIMLGLSASVGAKFIMAIRSAILGIRCGIRGMDFSIIVDLFNNKPSIFRNTPFDKFTDKICIIANGSKIVYKVIMCTILWPVNFIEQWYMMNNLEYEFDEIYKKEF